MSNHDIAVVLCYAVGLLQGWWLGKYGFKVFRD